MFLFGWKRFYLPALNRNFNIYALGEIVKFHGITFAPSPMRVLVHNEILYIVDGDGWSRCLRPDQQLWDSLEKVDLSDIRWWEQTFYVSMQTSALFSCIVYCLEESYYTVYDCFMNLRNITSWFDKCNVALFKVHFLNIFFLINYCLVIIPSTPRLCPTSKSALNAYLRIILHLPNHKVPYWH